MLVQAVNRLYNSLVGSQAITTDVFPAGAIAVTCTNGAAWVWGVYAQIVATVGAADVWLIAIDMLNPSAATQYEVEVATGAGAAEVPLAVVVLNGPCFVLPNPRRIPAATRIAARSRGVTNAATVDVKVTYALGL